jgi:hypothetical protein
MRAGRIIKRQAVKHCYRLWEQENVDVAPGQGGVDYRAVADAPVIERHNPAFDPRTGEGGLTLWIPLAL